MVLVTVSVTKRQEVVQKGGRYFGSVVNARRSRQERPVWCTFLD